MINLRYVVFLFFICSCSKYEQNSIYHIDKLPILQTDKEIEYNGDSIRFSAQIISSSDSKILRYGHIWGHDSLLNFNNMRFKSNSIINVKDFYSLPIDFYKTTNNFDRNKALYYNSYAINEAGIAYGQEYKICSEIYFDRYSIIQESVIDNKITPGETITLKMFFKNKSPVNSLSTRIHDIPQSNFLSVLTQISDINLTPNIISQSNESNIIVTFKIASNVNSVLDFKIFIKDDCSDKIYDVKTFDKKNLKFIIN